MAAKRPISVLVVCTHPLLGEGLSRMLAIEPDLAVATVPEGTDVQEAIRARVPDVVVVERGIRPPASELMDVASGTLFIEFGLDAGPVFSYQREEISARPGGILRAIRHARRAAVASAPGAIAVLVALSGLQVVAFNG